MHAFIAALHFIALGIGFTGVILRYRCIQKDLSKIRLKELFFADNLWGVAALLWLVTGLLRAFGGYAKCTDYYLVNGWFYIKILLFLSIFLLELFPIVQLTKWRLQRKSSIVVDDQKTLLRIQRISRVEIILLFFIVFIASQMAREVLPL